MKRETKIERHVLTVLVDNEFGVLARVIGLFSGRGYNIESLTVAEVDEEKNLSRITIVTSGIPTIIEQIKALLLRLVPVYEVQDLTVEGNVVERELALVRVESKGAKRLEAMRMAESFEAIVVDATPTAIVFEMTGSPDKLDSFIKLMKPLGLTELNRTGVTAMLRG
jgi:acetolactate synthase-1/3 small subunit